MDPLNSNSGKPSLETLQMLQDNLPIDVINNLLRVAPVSVTTGGDAGIEAVIPVGAKIIGAVSICTKTNGGGSMTVKTGETVPNDITDALQAATDKEVDYAATIDNAYNIVTEDGVKVFANGSADAADVFILYYK
jgi:hypothetical protein